MTVICQSHSKQLHDLGRFRRVECVTASSECQQYLLAGQNLLHHPGTKVTNASLWHQAATKIKHLVGEVKPWCKHDAGVMFLWLQKCMANDVQPTKLLPQHQLENVTLSDVRQLSISLTTSEQSKYQMIASGIQFLQFGQGLILTGSSLREQKSIRMRGVVMSPYQHTKTRWVDYGNKEAWASGREHAAA